MKNKIFSLLLVVLFIFGVSLLVKDQEGYLYVENRNKSTNSDIFNECSINSFNNVLSDQIWYRDNILKLFYQFHNKFIFGDKYVCYNREFIRINDFYLDNTYNKLNQEILGVCSNKAYNLNQISNQYPDIKMYLYYPKRALKEQLLDSVYFPNNIDKYEEEFFRYLGDKFTIRTLTYSDEDITKYFYKTDWHNNSFGANVVYQDIVDMVNEDNNIGNPRQTLTEKIISDNYKGACSNANGIDDVSDIFLVKDYGIDANEYDYFINDKKTSIDIERNSINDRVITSTRTYDSYYNSNSGIVKFDYNNDTKKNVLIYTDSFIGPIKEVLSSHFNKTIFICGWECFDDFSLEKIIKENDIDIVLFLWYQQNLFYNGYYFVPIN